MFPSKSSGVICLIFRFMIHFGLIFVQVVIFRLRFIFNAYECPVVSTPLLKTLPLLNCLCTFDKNQFAYFFGSISGLSIMSH